MTTVGTLTWHKAGELQRRPAWGIQALPHVMIRVKRIFPRVQTSTTGRVHVVDTPDVAADLEWLTVRHPLDMDDATAARLATRVAEHRTRVTAVDDLMAGRTALALELEPSRKLREYQLVGAQMARTTGRMILGDEVGLGKTTTGGALFGDPDALPALVVCPPHLQRQWVRELGEIWPLLRCHIATKGTPYDLARVRGSGGSAPDVLIISYPKLAGWEDALAGQFPTVIFDEVHDLRAGTDTKKGTAAARIADPARTVLGMTATAVFNYGDEIHNLYSIIHPDALGSRAEFLREHGGRQVGNHATIADPAALGSYLREQGLFLRRSRRDVGRELPDAQRIRHEIDSDPAALDAVSADVAAMARLVLDSTANREDRFVAAGQFDLKLRQATGVAKAPYVAEFVRLLLESEERVVLFGWHRQCYDIWLDRLADYNPALYTGTESPTQKQAAVDRFTRGDSRVLMISLRSGAGLDGLQQYARTCVFGELDWSPAVHDQAIGRLNRDGQEHPVAAYFPVSNTGADPTMEEVLQLKQGQSRPINDPDAPLFEPTPEAALDRVRLLARQVLRGNRPAAAA